MTRELLIILGIIGIVCMLIWVFDFFASFIPMRDIGEFDEDVEEEKKHERIG